MSRARSFSDQTNDEVGPGCSADSNHGDKDRRCSLFWGDISEGVVWIARRRREKEGRFRDKDCSDQRGEADYRLESCVGFFKQDPCEDTCRGKLESLQSPYKIELDSPTRTGDKKPIVVASERERY
jgi:hypothetical protein